MIMKIFTNAFSVTLVLFFHTCSKHGMLLSLQRQLLKYTNSSESGYPLSLPSLAPKLSLQSRHECYKDSGTGERKIAWNAVRNIETTHLFRQFKRSSLSQP